ncbi:MAG TPA: SufE family protein [Tepidiformaceae bacterium]|jgi:sulfur transfer protein SufE|nr:SufE family protein [Tepidiformaceae bacterium]
MTDIPAPLESVLEDFAFVDRAERAELLIEAADRFEEVPPTIATRPFPEENHVQRCESEAYVWAEDRPDGTLKFHFAVENPQGLSAKSWGVIMDETLSGQPLAEVAAVSPEVVFAIYGKDLSMGKGQGLMGMLSHVTHAAKERLAAGKS